MLQFFIILFIALHVISWIGLAQIFKKANVPSWKAFVPFMNWSEWLKLIGKPQWYILLLCIPVVNFFYGAYIHTGMARAFKRYNFAHHALAVLFFWAYILYLGFSKTEKYYGVEGLREGEHPVEYGSGRKWVDSILFAVLAAHFIRMFFIEAYAIPTSSMESSLQIGDFMFVSKMHYGSRIPNTPLSLPLIHHTIPKTKARAYSEAIKFDYHRLPALQKIKRNDIVVFNIPFEHDMQNGFSKIYYDGITYNSRPVDKREHYIKRAVAIPRDTLHIENDQLYINNTKAENPEHMQLNYLIEHKSLSKKDWRNKGVRAYFNYFNKAQNPTPIKGGSIAALNAEVAKQLESDPDILSIKPADYSQEKADFPKKSEWSMANYGPIVVPAKGMTITLTPENYPQYHEAITVHEKNKVEFINGAFIINGKETKEYTFSMDYYFMMGDNRHSSLDSREWGFVPEDHIVGKPLFIFFSKQGGSNNPGYRLKRFFKKAQDMN